MLRGGARVSRSHTQSVRGRTQPDYRRPRPIRTSISIANRTDAAAICEAVSRPSMRFVEIKSEAQQAAAGIHKVREMLMKQRTMLIDALRGLMAEFGIVVGAGTRHVGELTAIWMQ